MRIPWLVAAGLMVLLSAGHSYLGEHKLLMRLFRRDNLPRFTRQTMRLAWHITSIFGLGIAAMLVVLARSETVPLRTMSQIITVTCAASGLFALVCSRGRHLSWVVFGAVAALAWAGGV